MKYHVGDRLKLSCEARIEDTRGVGRRDCLVFVTVGSQAISAWLSSDYLDAMNAQVLDKTTCPDTTNLAPVDRLTAEWVARGEAVGTVVKLLSEDGGGDVSAALDALARLMVTLIADTPDDATAIAVTNAFINGTRTLVW